MSASAHATVAQPSASVIWNPTWNSMVSTPVSLPDSMARRSVSRAIVSSALADVSAEYAISSRKGLIPRARG